MDNSQLSKEKDNSVEQTQEPKQQKNTKESSQNTNKVEYIQIIGYPRPPKSQQQKKNQRQK
jgi:hypothetical protein